MTTRMGTSLDYRPSASTVVDASLGTCLPAPGGTPAGAIAGASPIDERLAGAHLNHATGKLETSEPDAALNVPTVKVMTVDDSAAFRAAAREVVEATTGFEHLGDARSGEEALALAKTLAPDLVLVDVRMPGIDGLETARRLKLSRPETTTVLVSTAEIESLPSGYATCGAAAFIRKQDFGPSTLRAVWAEHRRRADD
jgi:two-component system, NarL family, invasion response regulator UvrY